MSLSYQFKQNLQTIALIVIGFCLIGFGYYHNSASEMGLSMLLVIIAFLNYRDSKGTTHLCNSIKDVMTGLKSGDVSLRLKVHQFSPHYQALAETLNDACDIIDVMQRESILAMASISKGKLYRKIMLQGLPGEFKLSASAINETIDSFYKKNLALHQTTADFEGNIKSLVENVITSVESLTQDFQELLSSSLTNKEKSTQVLSESENAGMMISSLSQASNELSQAISEVSYQVGESNNFTLNASKEVKEASESIYRLKEVSQEINAIISLITEIAEQTNLLALNATIEAARAGEYGKSFSVVAAEVKNLANKTMESSEKIVNQVNLTHSYVDTTVQSIDKVLETLNQLSSISSAVAAAVEQQSSTTHQISNNMNEGMNSIMSVNKNMHDMSKIATATFESSTQMRESLSTLESKISNIREDINKFSSFIKHPTL